MHDLEPLPPLPQTFEIRPGTKFLVGFLTVFFCVLMLASLAIVLLPDRDSAKYVGAAIFSSFFAMLTTLALVARWRIPGKSITIDRDGIWYTSRGKANSLLAWRHVQWVRESQFWQRIHLLDPQGKRQISLDFTLDDLGRLRRIIAGQMQQHETGDRLPAVYRISLATEVIFVILFAGTFALAFAAIWREPSFSSAAILLFPAVFLVGPAINPRRILIDRDRIEVAYLLKSYGYDLSQIVDVQVQSRQAGLRQTTVLFIEVSGSRFPICVRFIKGGVLPIYETLCRVMGKKSEPAPSPGPWPFGGEAISQPTSGGNLGCAWKDAS